MRVEGYLNVPFCHSRCQNIIVLNSWNISRLTMQFSFFLNMKIQFIFKRFNLTKYLLDKILFLLILSDSSAWKKRKIFAVQMLLQHEKFVTNGKMYFSSWLKRNNNFLNVVTILWKSPLWYVIPYCHLSDPLPLPVKYVFLLKNYVLKILGFLSMHQYAFKPFPTKSVWLFLIWSFLI